MYSVYYFCMLIHQYSPIKIQIERRKKKNSPVSISPFSSTFGFPTTPLSAAWSWKKKKGKRKEKKRAWHLVFWQLLCLLPRPGRKDKEKREKGEKKRKKLRRLASSVSDLVLKKEKRKHPWRLLFLPLFFPKKGKEEKEKMVCERKERHVICIKEKETNVHV